MISFNMNQESATALINLLGQLPTNSGVYPILVQMVAQFNEQTTKKENDDGAVTESA